MYNVTMKQRFKISVDGNPTIKFYTKNGLLLATGYKRIVIGGRGAYIEFDPSQIAHDNIYVPKYAEHKLENNLSYYHEYRSKDECDVKLYDQKLRVSYADYKVGMWYISPNVVKTDEFEDLLPLYQDSIVEASDEPNLFDTL